MVAARLRGRWAKMQQSTIIVAFSSDVDRVWRRRKVERGTMGATRGTCRRLLLDMLLDGLMSGAVD